MQGIFARIRLDFLMHRVNIIIDLSRVLIANDLFIRLNVNYYQIVLERDELEDFFETIDRSFKSSIFDRTSIISIMK